MLRSFLGFPFAGQATLRAAMLLLASSAMVFAVVGAAGTSIEVSMPRDISGSETADLSINVQSDSELTGARLTIEAPAGFNVTPASRPLPSFRGKLNLSAQLRNTMAVRDGERRLVVNVASSSTNGLVLDSAVQAFTYHNEQLLWSFFCLGFAGIAVGYVLRLLMKVLAGITPPPPLPAAADPNPEGPITRYARRHFYRVDFVVTVVLGIIVLAATLHSGHAPLGSTWHSTLLAGVTLGLLTNSELITRLR